MARHASGRVLAFQHGHPLDAAAAQRDRRGEPRRPAADDGDVGGQVSAMTGADGQRLAKAARVSAASSAPQ